MQFISNKISIGSTKSFDDICQEFLDKKNATVKTASTTEVVKVAEADEAEGSGQLEVEPLHQEGESTNQDSVVGGKSDGGGNAKATAKSSDEEGEDSGQPKAEGSEKFTNDPKVDADAGSDTEIKEADAKEDEEEEKEAATDKDDAEGEEKEADADSKIKEAGEKGMCDCGKPNFICKGKCKGDGEGPHKDDDKDCDKEDDKEDKEASTKPSFTKIANLTSEEKTRLGKFWKNLYPADFVDAMLADK